MKNEEDYILLSQLTHAGYCLRRAALVMNEQIWSESADTAKGRQEHKNVHERRVERRGDEIKLYEYDVVSHALMIRGKCDCIEVNKDENGCRVPFSNFPVCIRPVEYKHGKVRDEEEYNLQLCAQAMCLEEMYRTTIREGVIFYTSSHRRVTVKLDETLREQVKHVVEVLNNIKESYCIPSAEFSAKCKKCSMLDLCLPQVEKSAESYCDLMKKEAQEVIR